MINYVYLLIRSSQLCVRTLFQSYFHKKRIIKSFGEANNLNFIVNISQDKQIINSDRVYGPVNNKSFLCIFIVVYLAF